MIYTHIMVEGVVDASFLNLAGHLHIQTAKEFASVRIGRVSVVIRWLMWLGYTGGSFQLGRTS